MPKIVNHEEYKRELLSNSYEVFAKRGYSALTMRDLAKSLEVSTGTLYHYFPSKLELFEQLVVLIAERDMSKIASIVDKSQSTEVKLDLIFEYLEQIEPECQKQMLIMIDALRELGSEEAGKISGFERADNIYMKGMCELFDLDDDTSIFLGCAINGLLIERMINPSQVSIQAQKKFILQILKTNKKH